MGKWELIKERKEKVTLWLLKSFVKIYTIALFNHFLGEIPLLKVHVSLLRSDMEAQMSVVSLFHGESFVFDGGEITERWYNLAVVHPWENLQNLCPSFLL